MSEKISKHFTEEEATCNCGNCEYRPVDSFLLIILDDVRDHFNSPVTATCMVRCPVHNAVVGGAKSSRHLPVHADAADIKVKGVEPKDVFEYVNTKYPDAGGLHAYNSFIHIDTRGWPARW